MTFALAVDHGLERDSGILKVGKKTNHNEAFFFTAQRGLSTKLYIFSVLQRGGSSVFNVMSILLVPRTMKSSLEVFWVLISCTEIHYFIV